MNRPFFNSSITELEKVFEAMVADRPTLEQLLCELNMRSAKRAVRLREQVVTALAKTKTIRNDSNHAERSSTPESGGKSVERTWKLEQSVQPPVFVPPECPSSERQDEGLASQSAKTAPFPQVSNEPAKILDAWIATEILSPPSFKTPQAFAGGDSSRIAHFDRGVPWPHGRSKPNYRLYYQIVLGSIKMEHAIEALVQKFGDTRVERLSAQGYSALAVIVVNKDGILLDKSAVEVASFGWGLMEALKGDLKELADWKKAEKGLVELIEKSLSQEEPERTDLAPIEYGAILRAFNALSAALDIPSEWLVPPQFAIRSFVYFKDPNPPEPILLNSFFLDDLIAAKSLFVRGEATKNLRAYLGVDPPKEPRDLLNDRTALEEAVSPKKTLPTRWPSRGRHSLSLLQQAAVNLAFSETTPSGILGVNGPPGTGKTTLLRDIVANVVVERASAMCQYDDPESAFKNSGERLQAGGGWIHLYRMDSSLKGFEMVVASSNNKAVENVSSELPGMMSIASEASTLRYFKTLSDALHKDDTWGAIAAVLGNTGNRARFKQLFWWDDDMGMNSYLRAVLGSASEIEVSDDKSGRKVRRLPRIVTAENPPTSRHEALARWKETCVRFKAAKAKSLAWIDRLEEVRSIALQASSLRILEKNLLEAKGGAELNEQQKRAGVADLEVLYSDITQELARVSQIEEALRGFQDSAKIARGQALEAKTAVARHERARPGAIRQFFSKKSLGKWLTTREKLIAHCAALQSLSEAAQDSLTRYQSANLPEIESVPRLKEEYRLADSALTGARSALAAAEVHLERCSREHAKAQTALEVALARIEEARSSHGIKVIDDSFWELTHAERHTATPWFPEEAQRAREELFAAAMGVHRAFIDAAAKPIRHNLSALMNVFTSQCLPTAAKQALLGDLWSTLFTVVPLVSTTFASVNRMLGKLPKESLGWLLIDEGGQAAIGALMRTQKAIILGDPMQIEPVVSLPDVLTQSIFRRFAVDPARFGAPEASAQTLADAASQVMAEFPTKHGSRTVGVPLLVHRRCESPMFEISNHIAYGGLMVTARPHKNSPIRDCLGDSAWIHVEGSGQDKWCEDEGKTGLGMLQKLKAAGVYPDLYIISPFVVVAEHMRQLILQSNTLNGWVGEEASQWVRDRVGTVHTVQGREAEAIILVLGAPNASQNGARGWAGGRPNLLNVAVTRAKDALYVVGNRQLWKEAGVFAELDWRIDCCF